MRQKLYYTKENIKPLLKLGKEVEIIDVYTEDNGQTIIIEVEK